ncbi:MAG: c-type cytochrome [Anaerolineales bacterium]
MSHVLRPTPGLGRHVHRFLSGTGLALIAGGCLIFSGCSLAQEMKPFSGGLPLSATSSWALVSPVPTEPVSPDQIDLRRGASLFSSHCASCHGASGHGDGPLAAQFSSPVPALAAPEVFRPASPSQWFAMVTRGNLPKFMPPFGDVLSAADRWDVTYYALTLGTPASSLAQASQIYAQQCASCHGAGGKGGGVGAKRLPAPLADLTKPSALVGASGQHLYNLISQGSPRGMPSASSDLTEDQRWSLVGYVRSLAEGPSGPGLQGSGGADPPAAPSAVPSATPSTVSRVKITGQVTDGTTGKPLASQAVVVQSFSGTAVLAQQGALTDSQGNFELQGVALPGGESVAAAVNYRGVTYSSVPKQGPSASGSISLPVAVYDTTTDASLLSMDEQHIFVESIPDRGVLRVGVLAIFSNSGRRTVVASQVGGGILVFDLPAGAKALQFGDGAVGSRYLLTASGFADTQAVLPGSGSHEVLYSFELPAARTVPLRFPVRYPLAGEVILVPPTLRVQSNQIVDSGPQQIQGGTYEQYAGGSLSPGQSLDLTILDQSQSPAGFGSRASIFIGLGLGLLVLGLLRAGLYVWRRRSSSGERPPQGASDREALLRSIAALDDAHEAGELEDEAYRIRREELKARLLEMSAAQEPDLK